MIMGWHPDSWSRISLSLFVLAGKRHKRRWVAPGRCSRLAVVGCCSSTSTFLGGHGRSLCLRGIRVKKLWLFLLLLLEEVPKSWGLRCVTHVCLALFVPWRTGNSSHSWKGLLFSCQKGGDGFDISNPRGLRYRWEEAVQEVLGMFQQSMPPPML